MERLGAALTPQLAVEVAAKTARAEARGAVQGILAEERQRQEDEVSKRKDRLRPFFGFMESLRNLAAVGPGGEGPEGRTELVLKLYRLETNGGPKPSKVFQTQVALSQEEALGLGDPDFEGRTMEWALQQGQFGRFEWRLLGWADGESILDTSYNVTVEQPANYVSPVRPAVVPEPEAKPDPMGQLKETLGLLGMMRESLGLKGGGGLDATQLEIVKAAAGSQARLEAATEHRRELRELEDRHRNELEAAERKGYERGKAEGDRTLEAERLRWDLQKAQEAPEGPSFVQEVAGVLGGPQQVQNLLNGVMTFLNRPNSLASVPPRNPIQRPSGGVVKPLQSPVGVIPEAPTQVPTTLP
ncbi:MAG TPA: hypothetical protein VN436_18305, partial [Holophaga sp.]|nr:hypothetical protein [Holophaga sp.]